MNWIKAHKGTAAAALALALSVPAIARAGPDIDVNLVFSDGHRVVPGYAYHPARYRHPGRGHAWGHRKHKRGYYDRRYYGRSDYLQLRLGDFSIISREYRDRNHRDRDRDRHDWDRDRRDRDRDRRERNRERRW